MTFKQLATLLKISPEHGKQVLHGCVDGSFHRPFTLNVPLTSVGN